MIEQTHCYLHGEKVAFGTLVQLILEGQKTEEIEEVLNFCFSVGLPITLEQIGIKEINDSILDSIVSRALIDSENIHNEPFKVTKPLLKDAILSADEVGRQYLKKAAKGLFNG
jgi:glycerol dehydrogenase